MDINNRQLRVFRKGTDQGYESEVIIEENEEVSPLEFPDVSIRVSEMLPPILVE